MGRQIPGLGNGDLPHPLRGEDALAHVLVIQDNLYIGEGIDGGFRHENVLLDAYYMNLLKRIKKHE